MTWTKERREAMSVRMKANNPMKRLDVIEKHKKACAGNGPGSGVEHHFYGKKHSEESKRKIAENCRMKREEERLKHSIAMSGENNHFWIHGKSSEPYHPEFNQLLKRQIRERDNIICQVCQCGEEPLGRALDIHHIDYDKNNNNSDNLIGLCHSCHPQTNFERDGWMKKFREILGVAF